MRGGGIAVQDALNLNPFTHLVISYQEVLFYDRAARALAVAACPAVASFACSWRATSSSIACVTRSRRKCVAAADAAIDAGDVTKVYRRYTHKKQFATLKSALVSRQSASATSARTRRSQALKGVSFSVPKGCTYAHRRPQWIGQEHDAQVRRRHHTPDDGTVTVHGRISALIELGAGFHPEISGPRERLHQRHHARPDQARDHAAVRRDRGVRRARATSSTRR